MTEVQKAKENFNTIVHAASAGRLALVECQVVATGEVVAVICATNKEPDNVTAFVPLAQMIKGNPYEVLRPPNPAGGFHPTEPEQQQTEGNQQHEKSKPSAPLRSKQSRNGGS